MQIGYVTTLDPTDIFAWSGTTFHILQSLKEAGITTESVGNLKFPYPLYIKIKNALYTKLLKKTYFSDREIFVAKSFAFQVEKALSTIHSDFIFGSNTLPLAFLQTKKPVGFWVDATFAGMINYYPEWKNLNKNTIKNGNILEQRALSRCSLAIYSSDWAAQTAIENYDVDPAKIQVVPFGANILNSPSLEHINNILKNKNFNICKLLFIGIDWYRKGGDTALAIATTLNQQGIKTELHIVGCKPEHTLPNFAILHGFVSKKDENGRNLLDKLMKQSHFLILPSKAECFGIVFAEASAYGLPSLATNIGGIPSVITNGKNGQLFPPEAKPETYCEYIHDNFTKEKYTLLAYSSYKEYSEKLNWKSAGAKVSKLIQEFSK